MQYRKLGRHDIEVSVLGLGGVVVMNQTQDEADDEVARAIDRGITYFDVAPSYGDAEQRLGPALAPYRDRVTLACKTTKRTADEALAELEQSLRNLRTDHVDIYQMHALAKPSDTTTALGPGGAIETFLDAKRRGLTRLIGFSAHDEQQALIAVESGHFDTVLFPLNIVMFERGAFGPRLLAAANERGMGALAIKAMARTAVPKGEPRPFANCWYEPEPRPDVAKLLLRYTLNLPGVAATLPPGNPGLYNMAIDFASGPLPPLTNAEHAQLTEAVAAVEPLFANPTA
ncbi:MAG: aldo/keto reductase [Phycisphaeraceae bacterium]